MRIRGRMVTLMVLGLVMPVAAAAQLTSTSVQLTWTAPGDDSTSGTAHSYDLRRSTSPINAGNFSSATSVNGVPAPLVAGSTQTHLIAGLSPSTRYWFAIRTRDDAGNWSAISNLVDVTTLEANDFVRPAPLALVAGDIGTSSVRLDFTAVGDDSLSGTAAAYDVRWSTAPITSANFAAANQVSGEPAPQGAGTAQSVSITGLDRSADLWFAARVLDEEGNVSALSNVVSVTRILDSAPPSAPTGVAGSLLSGDIRVQWNPNPEADLAGYRVYRAYQPAGPYVLISASLHVDSPFIDTAVPDTAEVWYQVSAVDDSDNESARSTAVRVFVRGGDIAAWEAQPAFPNPSSIHQPVSFPIAVPPNGPFEARLEIQNSAGEHVRTLPLGGLSPGVTTVQWDGLNLNGRRTAPGVYRAWLVLGDQRRAVRVVRTP